VLTTVSRPNWCRGYRDGLQGRSGIGPRDCTSRLTVAQSSQPAFSRLLLGPDDRSDGIVNLYEIPGLPITGVDLVTLSACDTQLGRRSVGDEVAGINRAFLAAGAARSWPRFGPSMTRWAQCS